MSLSGPSARSTRHMPGTGRPALSNPPCGVLNRGFGHACGGLVCLDSIVSPGERENTQSYLRDIGAETQAVDEEEEESLTIAFTKIAALIGRPDVLAMVNSTHLAAMLSVWR